MKNKVRLEDHMQLIIGLAIGAIAIAVFTLTVWSK
jgi:hypothetical protein